MQRMNPLQRMNPYGFGRLENSEVSQSCALGQTIWYERWFGAEVGG